MVTDFLVNLAFCVNYQKSYKKSLKTIQETNLVNLKTGQKK